MSLLLVIHDDETSLVWWCEWLEKQINVILLVKKTCLRLCQRSNWINFWTVHAHRGFEGNDVGKQHHWWKNVDGSKKEQEKMEGRRKKQQKWSANECESEWLPEKRDMMIRARETSNS